MKKGLGMSGAQLAPPRGSWEATSHLTLWHVALASEARLVKWQNATIPLAPIRSFFVTWSGLVLMVGTWLVDEWLMGGHSPTIICQG